ncbi:Holliday junction branch migration protein RuvA [Sphingosinicella soli]|uniref:Holliday junction branch migration complex subunit RuvA n=1 Tax=Sphingosinicella soli TaxID=333708 RepID=A0A7W7F8D4_9SPHN|nr:Holliday junction branch migration protein RuvA [Sphingosinicella soli]MBB4633547.1 Holliday junction DNA helicase RuvA [Sphingosinicella soli]
MIAKLKGLLDTVNADGAVIDVNGVGYLVSASTKTLASLGGAGAAVMLHIETHVREDAIQLFGFTSERERDWFRLLQTVQGVGAKVALAILSVLSTDELHAAIANRDKTMVGRASGVGPKLAERIVNELKDKAGGIAGVTIPVGGFAPAAPAGGLASDALSALANLGYKPAEANRVVTAAIEEAGEGADVGTVVRLALKKAAR